MLNNSAVRWRSLASDEHHNEQHRVAPVLSGIAGYEHHNEQHRKNRQQGQEEGQSHTLKLRGFSSNDGKEEGQASRLYLNYSLPVMGRYGNVISVTAKSVTGIRTPENLEAQQDANRPFLLPEFQHTYQFMAGLEGLPTGRPVSSNTGSSNLSSPVTISRFEPWVTGSKIRGVCNMAITCRLALLEGNSPILCNRRVRGYIVLSFNSHQQARKEARRLNAVVVAGGFSHEAFNPPPGRPEPGNHISSH